MSKCNLCPRRCNVDRSLSQKGICGEGGEIRVARYSLHQWEEPPISGERGSGTIFFSGCSLRCEFCQNRAISHNGGKGEIISVERLCEIFFELEKMGAENVNLVTPTHFADKIVEALRRTKDRLSIPVVYNSSGYETVETLKTFEGLVDVYLPDFKYFSDDLALKYSSAKNYREYAEAAIVEMHRQIGKAVFDDRGIMRRGLIIRHLVLPSGRKDSMAVMKRISELLPKDEILISIMNQYTPDFAIEAGTPHRELHRKLTSFEYDSVLEYADSLGLAGFSQERGSASAKFTPDF